MKDEVPKDVVAIDPEYRAAFVRVTALCFSAGAPWMATGMLVYAIFGFLTGKSVNDSVDAALASASGVIFLILKARESNQKSFEAICEGMGLVGFGMATLAFAHGGYAKGGLIPEFWQAMCWMLAGVLFGSWNFVSVIIGFGGAAWAAALFLKTGNQSLASMGLTVTVLLVGAVAAVVFHRFRDSVLWYFIPLEVRDRDRTKELEQAKEQAQALNERFRQLSQASFEALVIYDKDKIIEINAAVSALFGYSAAELMGRDFLDLVDKGRRDQLSHATQMGSFRPMETVGLRKNGTKMPLELSIKLMPLEKKSLRVAAFRDLTELKATQGLLEHEKSMLEKQYRRQAALAELEVMVDDPKQYEVLLQQLVSVACQQVPARYGAFFNVDSDRSKMALHSSNLESMPNDAMLGSSSECPFAVRGILETGEPLNVSEVGRDAFGVRAVFPGLEVEAFLAVPMMLEGRMAGVLYLLRLDAQRFEPDDVTFVTTLNARVSSALLKVQLFEELRRANAQLERQHIELLEKNKELVLARDAAEASSRAKTQFLDTMSHELRTPLNGILGMIALLEYSELSDEQRENLQTMRESGESLLKQISDVLEFTQLDGGQIELQTGPVVAPLLLQSSVDEWKQKAEAKGLRISTQPAAGSLTTIHSDGGRIKEVINRLVDNAVKFTERGGTVTLRATQAMDHRGRAVMRFDVEDTGVGIKLEEQSKLFEAFRQADGAMNRKFGGIGLGLSICKRLVTLMGGDIGVLADGGRGSMFWFSIPVGK